MYLASRPLNMREIWTAGWAYSSTITVTPCALDVFCSVGVHLKLEIVPPSIDPGTGCLIKWQDLVFDQDGSLGQTFFWTFEILMQTSLMRQGRYRAVDGRHCGVWYKCSVRCRTEKFRLPCKQSTMQPFYVSVRLPTTKAMLLWRHSDEGEQFFHAGQDGWMDEWAAGV